MGRDRSRSLEVARDQAVTDNLFLYVNECKRNERRVRGAGGGGEAEHLSPNLSGPSPAGPCRTWTTPPSASPSRRDHPRAAEIPRLPLRLSEAACPRIACPRIGRTPKIIRVRPRSAEISQFLRVVVAAAAESAAGERHSPWGARRRSTCARPSSASSSTTPRSSGSPDLRPLAAGGISGDLR